MKKIPRDYLALALDNVSSSGVVTALVEQTAPSIGVFKIGLEQFTRFGPSTLEVVREHKRKIFLDLKFHDIPNTVEKAVQAACALGVDYLTIHTQGGTAMMRAAMRAAKTLSGRNTSEVRPKIIGVTLLTSIDEDCLRKELSVAQGVTEHVRHLAGLAVTAGLDGVVCSAADLPAIKPLLPENYEIITPGIRPAGCATHDQKRIATPSDAIKNGATLLVLGRAVTEAENPGTAAESILNEISLGF
jgi:orotidine-5'-phosphate decarboxylase